MAGCCSIYVWHYSLVRLSPIAKSTTRHDHMDRVPDILSTRLPHPRHRSMVDFASSEVSNIPNPISPCPPKAPVPSMIKALSGSFGGVMEAIFLQPIDVIKTRLQLDAARRYSGIAHCGTSIYREEGMRALWKGLTPFATHLTLKYALRMVRCTRAFLVSYYCL